MLLTIDKDGSDFVIEDAGRCGSPPIGRGRTMKQAMGDWLINNQRDLGIAFEVKESAKAAEAARRREYFRSR